MTVPSITYQTLVNNAATQISNLCNNITDYAGIEACFKSGYSKTESKTGTGQIVKTGTLTTTISSNAVPTQTVASTVTTELTNYVTSKGIVLANNITTNGLALFYNCLAAFSRTKVKQYISQMTTTKVICYNSGTTNFPTVNTETHDEILRAGQINNTTMTIGQIITNNMETVATRYSRSVTHT